jgi:hypothetical protein
MHILAETPCRRITKFRMSVRQEVFSSGKTLSVGWVMKRLPRVIHERTAEPLRPEFMNNAGESSFNPRQSVLIRGGNPFLR